MKTVLLLAPGMDGPQGHPYNASWPADLDRMVERLNGEGVENTPYNDREW